MFTLRRSSSHSSNKESIASPSGQLADKESSSSPKDDARPDEYEDAEKNYRPRTVKFWIPLIGMYLAIFLVGLDRTIVAVAIPKITDEFDSIKDIGWYGGAYMLTAACFFPICGKIYQRFSTKICYVGSLVVFEVGSALCGAAPNSASLIIGRAIAGIGFAGIMSGGMVLVLPLIPLRKRPLFIACFGMMFAASSVAGPVIGGSFTDHVTWRWCFYINLPLGGFTILATFLFLQIESPTREKTTLLGQIWRFDPIGILLFIQAIICLVLAIQWAGNTYAWQSSHIIGLFIGAGLLLIMFFVAEFMLPDIAMVPARVILNRSIAGSMTYTFLLSGGMMTVIYYLTIWFQASKGYSAIHAGICTIPLLLALVVASVIAAAFTQKVGYYVPPMLLSCVLCAVGAGLLSTLKPDSDHSYWIGYQVLYGIGIGTGFQQSNLSAQNVLKHSDVPLGMAVMFLTQQLGGALFLAVAQSVFSSHLIDKLSGVAGLDPQQILNTGATNLRKVVPATELNTVVAAYSYALTRTFVMTAILCAVMIVGPLAIEWRSIKAKPDSSGKEDKKSSDA